MQLQRDGNMSIPKIQTLNEKCIQMTIRDGNKCLKEKNKTQPKKALKESMQTAHEDKM